MEKKKIYMYIYQLNYQKKITVSLNTIGHRRLCFLFLVPLFSQSIIKIRSDKLTLIILEATLQSHPLQMLSNPLKLPV